MINNVYLKCTAINEGQFSNESAVRVTDYEGNESSGFFKNKSIKKGRLEVGVLDKNENLFLIGLPGRLENLGATNYLTVKKEQLEFEN